MSELFKKFKNILDNGAENKSDDKSVPKSDDKLVPKLDDKLDDKLDEIQEDITYDDLNDVLGKIENNENEFIVVTGGIGDFLTIEYFFSLSKKYNIIFISKQANILKKLMYNYKLPKKYFSLKFNFDIIKMPGFCSSEELFKYFPQFIKIKIVNISEYFSRIETIIKKNEKINIDDIFFNNKINNDIKNKYNIPDNFVLMCPYTEDNRIDCIKCNVIHKKISTCNLTRNFINDDYDSILNFCKKMNLFCLIISPILINIPEKYKNFKIINLSGKTSIFESIEISKMCTYYMGIDSFLTVFLTKIKNSNNIYIKCNNKHGRTNKNVYWYPHKNIKLFEIIKV